MIKAVIFDMDGLLIDSERFWQEEERTVFQELGIQLTSDMQHETYGLGTYELVQHWYRYQPWEGKDFETIVQDIYQRVAKRVALEGSPKDGVGHVIKFLSNKGLKLSLASSSPMMMIDIVMEKLKLKNEFEVIHSCQFESYEKPHPAVYISTADKMKVAPAECLVFEDSFVGLIAAIAARMKTVVVPDPDHRVDQRYDIANVKLNSLADLTEEHFQFINSLY